MATTLAASVATTRSSDAPPEPLAPASEDPMSGLEVTLPADIKAVSPFAAVDPIETAAIAGSQRGDRAAFEPLVRRYMRRAASFALGWTGDREEALDLSQEAFARAYGAIRGFDPTRPFYPWFHQILRNVCLTRLTRGAKVREVPFDDRQDASTGGSRGPAELDPQAALERRELQRALWEAIGRLPLGDREILILREFQELTYAEIADVLDVPRGTVMSRLHTARKRLRAQLAPRFEPAVVHTDPEGDPR